MWNDTPLTRLLGLRYPIVQGPFGGGLSTVALTASVSEEGGLGSFGAHHLQPDAVARTVTEIRALTKRPFAINFWVPHDYEHGVFARHDLAAHRERLRPFYESLGEPLPALDPPTVPELDAQVDAALDAGAPVLSFVMGIPPAGLLARARSRGVLTLATATTVDEAVALERAGLDAVVASGSDAGGHRGAFLRPVERSLVGTFSLIPQAADAVRIPVIAAGGVADARGVIAALALGAAGVQMGTTFLATDESGAAPAHREALASESARDTRLTRVFSGRTARGIANRFLEELAPSEGDVPPYPVQNWLTTPLRRAAATAGRPEFMALWAGQAAPLSKAGPARDRFRAIVAEVERRMRGTPRGPVDS